MATKLSRIITALVFATPFAFTLNETSVRAATVGTGACAITVGDSTNVSVSVDSNNDCVIYFKNVGTTTWSAPAGLNSVDVLLVGGGGGGGGAFDAVGAGGGGAGGMREWNALSITGGTDLSVVVGAGGAGGAGATNAYGYAGSNGGATSFDSISVSGGGGGGGRGTAGVAGASGGGPGGRFAAGVTGTGITGEGNSGGTTTMAYTGGAGGGGKSAVGATANSNAGAAGGLGLQSSVDTVATVYANGGAGGSRTAAANGVAGTTSTGNGGEGASCNSGCGRAGGNGGSGLVVVRYAPSSISTTTTTTPTTSAPATTAPATTAPATTAPATTSPATTSAPNTTTPSVTTVPTVVLTIAPRTTTTTTTTVKRAEASNDSTTTTSSTTSTSSSTTTTTVVPADPIIDGVKSSSGEAPKPQAGEAIVIINGEATSVKLTTTNNRVEVELPSGVRLAISAFNPANSSVTIGEDGVIRMGSEDSFRIVASDLKPGSKFGIVMFSEPKKIGNGVTTENGDLAADVSVPTDADAGRHTIQINAFDKNNEVVSISTPIEILGKGSSAIGRVVLFVIFAALVVAVMIPSSLRRRRRA